MVKKVINHKTMPSGFLSKIKTNFHFYQDQDRYPGLAKLQKESKYFIYLLSSLSLSFITILA